jgi:hypothetical protein
MGRASSTVLETLLSTTQSRGQGRSSLPTCTKSTPTNRRQDRLQDPIGKNVSFPLVPQPSNEQARDREPMRQPTDLEVLIHGKTLSQASQYLFCKHEIPVSRPPYHESTQAKPICQNHASSPHPVGYVKGRHVPSALLREAQR